MRIYRMESDSGVGMYRAAYCGPVYSLDQQAGYERHPAPTQDAGMSAQWGDLRPSQREKYFFGFSSLAQWRRWLYTDEVLDYLYGAGVRLAVYDVPDESCIVGFTQAVFLMSDAVKLGHYEDWRVAGTNTDPYPEEE